MKTTQTPDADLKGEFVLMGEPSRHVAPSNWDAAPPVLELRGSVSVRSGILQLHLAFHFADEPHAPETCSSLYMPEYLLSTTTASTTTAAS